MDTIELIKLTMERDLQHLSNVSHNIANVNTSGFLAVDSFEQVLDGRAVVSKQNVATGKSAINETGRALDFAIQGQGLFSVQLNEKVMLTRNGRFHVDAQGVIRHHSGAAVLGKNGVITVPDANFSISSSGVVTHGQDVIDELLLVNVQSVTPAKEGKTLYVAASPVTGDVHSKVKHSALNAASVNPSHMSIKMLEISRHLQSMQKAAAAYDQMLNTGISEIGKRN